MDWQAYEKRMEWFRHDRFGMFIHWGLYSIPARGEWVKQAERMTDEEYQKYFDEFDPKQYEPREWAKLAKAAGMRYAVLTAKHHDGFCLFDSRYTDYKSTVNCGRDLVREYVDAFRAEGLKVGLYYSLIDWHHPDFPHCSDMYHPMRENPAYPDEGRDFDRYLDYMHHQVEELCTNYGKLDILWFDFSYGEMRGEKWRATELMQMVRRLQPDVIVDNRLEVSGEGYGSIATDDPTPYSGDFVSPEQIIPPGGLRRANGDPLYWESCMTMNNHWGFDRYDRDFKPARTIIRKLVECVSKDGNLLLNVGPDPHGRIPQASVDILREVGRWMEKNSDSIYGCTSSPWEKPEYGRFTRRGNKVYVHVTDDVIGPIPVHGIRAEQLEKARILATGAELPTASGWVTANYPDYLFFHYGPDQFFTYPLPDPIDTVLELTLKE